MSVEKVRAYFARFGMEDRVNELPQSSATVHLLRKIKSLLFSVNCYDVLNTHCTKNCDT